MSVPFRTEYEVAVIGAGAAGIAAARTLAAAGVATILLEARQRAGGRAWTQMHAGYPLDLGCGWLHSADHNAYTGMARAMGFSVDETLPPWRKMMFEDAFAFKDQVAFRTAQEQFYARLEQAAAAPQDRAAAECLDPGAPWNGLIDAVSTYVNGCELARLSAKDFNAYEDSEINFRITAGYGALISTLAADLPVIYGCPVHRIDHSGVTINLETPQGTVRAGHVIIAVPTNILAHESIRITPPLPEKIEAAAMLPLGVADKIFLHVTHAEGLPDNGRIFGKTDRTNTGAYHLRPFGRPLIEGYFGGTCARELENEGLDGFAAFAIDEICGMLGHAWRARLKPLAASAWARDPFALGSYSHALPGHWDKRAVLAAPVNDRLFFAGEATSPDYFSTAHGAHESGLRAAEQVLAVRQN